MEHKAGQTFVKEIDGRTVTGIAAVFGNVDSQNDRIHKGAFSKTIIENGKRVKHLWQHNFRDPPVATINNLEEVPKRELPKEVREAFPEAKGGLLVTRTYLDTPRGDEVFEAINSSPPAITEMSFAYDPVKFDFDEEEEGKGLVRNLRELRLWDTSDVNWGANAATSAVKAVVPYKDTGKAGEGDAWKSPNLGSFTSESFEELGSAERRRIANHYTFSEELPPESFGMVKLPHHRAQTSGVGPAILRGVFAAMGALLGARGGVDIPGGDRRGVYNHLAKHYRQYDREPPDFSMLELSFAAAETLKFALGNQDHYGMPELSGILSELEDLLRAEPPSRALTPRALRARLEIAQREVVKFAWR